MPRENDWRHGGSAATPQKGKAHKDAGVATAGDRDETVRTRTAPAFTVICQMLLERSEQETSRVRTHARSRIRADVDKWLASQVADERSEGKRDPCYYGWTEVQNRTLVSVIRAGVPVALCDRLVDQGFIKTSELYSLVIPRRTLQHRRKSGEPLTRVESDRAMRFARIFDEAVAVFGSPEKGGNWLRLKTRLLGGERPIDLLDTEVGGRQVEDTLGRIAHGIAA